MKEPKVKHLKTKTTIELEVSPRITEDPFYLANCLGSLPAAKYSDGSHYVPETGIGNKSIYFNELLTKKGKRK